MSPWRPLLRGDDAKRALAMVRAIAETVSEPSHETRRHAHECALLHAYLAESGRFAESSEVAEHFLELAGEFLGDEQLQPALLGGFCGSAWVFAHLSTLADEDQNEDDELSTIDEALCDLVNRTPWTGDFDLTTGLVGYAVYALERRPRRIAQRLLGRISSRLLEVVRHDEQGARWMTPAELLPPERRLLSPDGEYDLGMAHGNAGVLALLARMGKDGVAGEWLDEGVRWLVAQALPDPRATRFPASIIRGQPSRPSRVAWCYGDCGIALAILACAKARGRADWRTKAIAIAGGAPGPDADGHGVVDIALCHGAAGVGHLYNRMYQSSGAEELGTRSVAWLRRAMEMNLPSELGLLDGRCGVALALLAAVSEVTPAWDRLFLASLE